MGTERRQFRRSDQPFEVQYRSFGALSDPWRIGRSADISATGLRLQTDVPVEAGEMLELALSLPAAQAPLRVRGSVLWSTALPSRALECGIEFRDLTQEQQADIDALVRFLQR